jgi:ribosomal protein L40E
MDTDIENLTLQNKKKVDKEICSKCHAAYQTGTQECPNCGVIFNKIKSPIPRPPTDSRGIQAPPPAAGNQKIAAQLETRKKLCGLLIFIAIISFGFYFLYVNYLESRIQARGFQSRLTELCSLEISKPHKDHVAEGADPFRIGKVLVVLQRQEVTLMNAATRQLYRMPLPQGIHPAWHRLDRKIRAKDPADVDTLIRVHKIIGKAGRYGKLKTKVFNTHKIVLEVYDWKNQTFIGTKIFDPGEGSTFMTEEDYAAMRKAVSDETIAEYIQSMDVQESSDI